MTCSNILTTPLGLHHPVPGVEQGDIGDFASTRWQQPYDYGTVFYSPSNRWQAHVDLDHHIFGVELTPGIVRTRLNSGVWNSHVCLSGALYFVAGGSTIEVRKQQPIDFVLVTLERNAALRLFEEAGLSGSSIPTLSHNLVDPAVERVAQQIRQKFMQDRTEISSLASELVVKAIDRLLDCGEVRRKPQRYKLAPYQVRATLDYINDNLASPLSVERLAQVTGLSGFFFAHAFTEMLGHSPHQYVMDRRLGRAREMITNTRSSLADIAYSVGFSSQAHMTSTFCRRFGVTPRALRQSHS